MRKLCFFGFQASFTLLATAWLSTVAAHPESAPGSCHFHTSSAEQHCAADAQNAAPAAASDNAAALVQPLLSDEEDKLPVISSEPDDIDAVAPAEESSDTVDQFQLLEARTAMIAGIQGGLARLGYQPGPATGMMSRKTENAIKAFQRDQLLPVSGQPSRSLLIIIEDEVASRQRR